MLSLAVGNDRGRHRRQTGSGCRTGPATSRAATARVWSKRSPWCEHRAVINGILWKLRTGSPWRDLPERYGPWQTCYDRFNRWRRDGTWDRLLAHAQTKNDALGEVEWEVSVDDTVIRAHQHAAGARSKPSAPDEKRGS